MIIGDLADPIEGGPCYKLYTKSFYEHSVKPKLNRGGIFVTQVSISAYGKERDGGEEGENKRNNHLFLVNFSGRAGWNFQPHGSVLLHLQHFKAGVQM